MTPSPTWTVVHYAEGDLDPFISGPYTKRENAERYIEILGAERMTRRVELWRNELEEAT